MTRSWVPRTIKATTRPQRTSSATRTGTSEAFDLDDDGVITVDELEEFAGDPAVDDVIDMLEDDGYDGIEYENC